MNIHVTVADESHYPYAEDVCRELYLSSLGDKIGIARRTPEYIREKIGAGKAVIALTDDKESDLHPVAETFPRRQDLLDDHVRGRHEDEL